MTIVGDRRGRRHIPVVRALVSVSPGLALVAVSLRAHRPDDEVHLRWLRDGRPVETTAGPGDRADSPR